MNWLHQLRLRFRALFQKEKLDAQMDDEMRSHIEMQTQENIEAGIKPEEARYSALRQFGRVESIKEACRDQRGLPGLETLWQDLRYSARQLCMNPGFTAVAVLTLALGIGSTTAVFSIVDAVVLKPLPYEKPGQLVHIWEAPSIGGRNAVSAGAFLDWREHSSFFDQLSILTDLEMNFTGTGEPERINGVAMSANGLDLLRARPVLGRTFRADEDQPGKDKVVVLTHQFWLRRFDGEEDIIGRTVRLNDESYNVVGVLPARFLPWSRPDLVMPLGFTEDARTQRGNHYLRVIGRLKSGATIEQAQAELNSIRVRLDALYPTFKKGWGVTVVAMQEQIAGAIKPTLLLLLGAVAFVLLIACANVANLILAKVSARRKEIAIRAAVGATRWRVIRQFLAEGVLLSSIGGVLGIIVAWWSVRGVGHIPALNLPRVEELGIDLRVLVFTLGISIATGVLFSLVPAFQASRPNLNQTLNETGRGSSSANPKFIRGGLIIADVALALILLAGAGLLLNSFWRITRVDPGFNTKNGLSMDITLPMRKYPDPASRTAFIIRLVDRIASLPGVEAAGLGTRTPLVQGPFETLVKIDGRPDEVKPRSVDFDFCTPQYFRALGIPLVRGRVFNQFDTTNSPRVAIVNSAFVREVFPDEDPLGKHIVEGRESWEIIGVVGDVRSRSLVEKARPLFYRPQAFSFAVGGNLVVRTVGAPAALAQTVRQTVLAADSDLPAANLRVLGDLISVSVAQRRFVLTAIGLFAGAALALTAIGLYGVVAYSVAQRTREIGIRMALGATRGKVLLLIVRGGLKPVWVGLLLGVVGALALTSTLGKLLYDINPTDPLTFACVSTLLLIVALLALWLPACRAAAVQPITALRSE